MKPCPHHQCRQLIPDDAGYCPYCRRPVRPWFTRRKKELVTIIVSVAVGIASGFLLWSRGSEPPFTIPGPTPTPYPTYTPGPTATAYPTYTPAPTARPFPTCAPLPRTGLDVQSSVTTLDTNVQALLGPAGPEKDRARSDLRARIRQTIAPYALRRAGIVLTFGVSPDPFEGSQLAREVNRVLLEEFPQVFEVAILGDYHIIDRDLSHRGNVEMEIYFLMETR
jgi:hypothetical protein